MSTRSYTWSRRQAEIENNCALLATCALLIETALLAGHSRKIGLRTASFSRKTANTSCSHKSVVPLVSCTSLYVFRQDTGGDEFLQLYRLDLAGENEGRATLLTDGRSRNTSLMALHAHPSGDAFAYMSTLRTTKDTDLWLVHPLRGETKLLLELEGGGWQGAPWRFQHECPVSLFVCGRSVG